MGGITKALFGGSESKQKSSSTPKDLTPQEFVGLRPTVANQLQNVITGGGLPGYTGAQTAPLTGAENQFLGAIQTQAMGQGGTGQAQQNLLQNILSGQQIGQGPVAQGQPLDIMGIGGGVQQGQQNPFLQQAIDAAQRPLIQEFENITAPALRSQFTQAGQQIQGTGSSPFQEAAAQAQTGLANSLADIAGRLSYQDFSQRQALQSGEFQQLRGLMAQQEQAQQALKSQEYQQERQRQLDAVSAAQGVDRGQLENLIAGLEAQALPRLVEQFGIDRGLEEFRNRQNQLLQAIQLSGGLSSPTIAQISTSSGSSSTTPGFLGGLGSFMGSVRS